MADLSAGTFSADSYPAWEIGPGQPLSSQAGGTGVSNPSAPISGAQTLTVAAVSGCSGIVFNGFVLLDSVSTVVGSKVNVVCDLTFTATASTAVFDITMPAAITGNFPDTEQALGIGIVIGASAGDGVVVTIQSVAASTRIRSTFSLGASSGSFNVSLSFSFLIN